MKRPGPFDIQRVQKFEWPHRELEFLLLPDATAEDFIRTPSV